MRVVGNRSSHGLQKVVVTLIVTALACLTALAIGRAGARSERLPDWMHPGVRLGSSNIQKSLFHKFDGIGLVSDIEYGELRSPGEIELGVAGNYGARFFKGAGIPSFEIAFKIPEPEGFSVSAKIVNQTPSNAVLFFRQAGAAATYDSIVDAKGEEVWKEPDHSIGSTFGYVGKNGGPQFFFGKKNHAVEARDVSGSVLWETAGVGWATGMGVISHSDDGGSEILVADGERLAALNLQGELLFVRRVPTGSLFADFAPIRWSPVCKECLLASSRSGFPLLATDASKILADLGPAGYVAHVQALPVKLFADEPPFLAVAGLLQYQGGLMAGFTAVHAEPYIFDSNKHLVYDEVLSEAVGALGVLPTPDGQKETLLVGGENKVWQYSSIEAKAPH